MISLLWCTASANMGPGRRIMPIWFRRINEFFAHPSLWMGSETIVLAPFLHEMEDTDGSSQESNAFP